MYHFFHTHLPHLSLALFYRHFSPISLFLIFWIQDLVEEEHTHAHTKVLHHYGFSYLFFGVGCGTQYVVSSIVILVKSLWVPDLTLSESIPGVET